MYLVSAKQPHRLCIDSPHVSTIKHMQPVPFTPSYTSIHVAVVGLVAASAHHWWLYMDVEILPLTSTDCAHSLQGCGVVHSRAMTQPRAVTPAHGVPYRAPEDCVRRAASSSPAAVPDAAAAPIPRGRDLWPPSASRPPRWAGSLGGTIVSAGRAALVSPTRAASTRQEPAGQRGS